MTQVATALSTQTDSNAAGADLGRQIAEAFQGDSPDAVVVFASAQHEYGELLRALQSACRPVVLAGCSSAGEFTSGGHAVGATSAVALSSTDMSFSVSVGRGLRADGAAAAAELVSGFGGLEGDTHRHRYALLLTDALAGQTDGLVEDLTRLTAGRYQFFGGGAGDDARFARTHVFIGTEAVPDAVVALEILSNKPLGIGVRHGWKAASAPMRVTESQGTRVLSLNARPALEVMQAHAAKTGQRFDPDDPMPFFLHNTLGVDAAVGYRVRVPLGVDSAGAVVCAADVPEGAVAHIMAVAGESATEAAEAATLAAVQQLGGLQPKAALFFDCVATRLRTGKEFGFELSGVQEALGPGAVFAGCNTYGQIARAEGQFGGFHNCTAVVCVIPD